MSQNKFLRSWAWKREHRPDKYRFDEPYTYKFNERNQQILSVDKLVIEQQRFVEEGFASTVWDSSIVMAKYFEKWPQIVKGKKCLDLSAGCGLVGICMAYLGAEQTILTDLPANLPLIDRNVINNSAPNAEVVSHWWGNCTRALGAPFDIISACDVMYREDVIEKLVTSLINLSSSETMIYVAHGRNRWAEERFLQLARNHFDIITITDQELDEVYQCEDVDVMRLQLRQKQ